MRSLGRIVWVAVAGLAVACGGSSNPSGPTPGGPSGPATLTAPVPDSPVSDAQLDTLRPTLTVRNGTSTGTGARTYEFHISDTSDFNVTTGVMAHVPGLAVVVSQTGVAEGTGGTTSFTPATDLQPATRMYWRARLTEGGATSAWSATAQFRTKLVGFNRAGELYDPLIHGETIGTRVGSTTFMDGRGLQVDNKSSWVRYVLASTLTSGEISVEVEGLHPDNPGMKSRIFSMMDGGSNLFKSKFLFNVQYRGLNGNPDNAISYKVLMGDSDLKFEPTFSQRAAGVRRLNPDTAYLWTATWGSEFHLTIREGGVNGPIVYDRTHDTTGTYNPSPQTVYLGANDAAEESGSYPRAIYRNLWVGNRPRPASLGSALLAP